MDVLVAIGAVALAVWLVRHDDRAAAMSPEDEAELRRICAPHAVRHEVVTWRTVVVLERIELRATLGQSSEPSRRRPSVSGPRPTRVADRVGARPRT